MSREQSPPNPDVLIALNRAATVARLMSGAVHEVNNALQVIAGSVELLEQQPALSPAIIKSLDRIKRQSERAAGTLAELQAFTKAPLDGRARFSLRELVLHAIALRRYAAARAGVTFDYSDGDEGAGLATGSVGLIEQAVLNLLINAEQAMTGRPGVAVVALRGDTARVGVEIVDAGPGLSEAAQASLFEPFATARDGHDGAGLGLWATQAIVAANGGSLDVSSTPTGLSVVLWLPRQ